MYGTSLLEDPKYDRVTHPSRYEHENTDRPTTRVCSEGECELPGTRVKGAYHVGPKRVRVWVCEHHANPDQLEEVPMPVHILAGIKAEEEYQAKMDKIRLSIPVHHSESVRAYSATGSGKEVSPRPRADSFHWGETAGDMRGVLPRSSRPHRGGR